MSWWVARLFAVVLVLCAGIEPALAEKRVALVIGNDAYVTVPGLQKAANDANAIGDTVAGLGFEVIRATNVSRRDMNYKIQEFASRIEPGDIAMLFYAGHGVEINGQNYLLPVDVPAAEPGQEEFVKGEAISFDGILTMLRGRNASLNILILDACRNNPFATKSGRSLGGTRGLARVEAPSGTFVMYSADAGEEALDRLGESDGNPNSVFTRTLLPLLMRPGLNLVNTAREARREVRQLASTVSHSQTPAYYDSVLGDFYFNKGKADGTGKPDQPPPADPVAADYQLAERIGTQAAWDAFLARHGSTAGNFHVDLARAARQKLALHVPAPPKIEPNKTECDGTLLASTGGAAKCLEPGDEFADCDDCPTMVVVPAGSFTMGSPKSEKERSDDEGPRHKVTIGEAFVVGKYEVTFAEWDDCLSDGGCKNYRPEDQGWGRGAQPVINVNWQDAQSYVEWLSKKTGAAYRLLSEAEWEYAARAGTTTPFSTGKMITTEEANFNGEYTYNGSGKGIFRKKTAEVGSFEANDFNLNDMHGNVWEWVEDCYEDSYRGAPDDSSARQGSRCLYRVDRGGSWDDDPRDLRSANRYRSSPDYRRYYQGFRLARTLRQER